jgi:hypothetical protein
VTKYIKNIFFGIIVLAGIVVLMKLSGWSPLNILLGPQYESKRETVTQRAADTQQLWWLSDYPKLIHKIDTTITKRLNTSWKTGPEGRSTVYLTLAKKGNSLVMAMKLPRQAVVMLNEKTSKTLPSSEKTVIVIRDHDLDGYPDDFSLTPGNPPENAMLTEDGFVKMQQTEEYASIFMQWMVGVGFTVNEFLYGIKSPHAR